MAVKNGKGKANSATNGHGGYDACKSSCASKLSVWAVIIAVVWGLCKVADKLNDGRFYIFDPTELHQCVNASLATAAAADQTQNASFIIESLLDNMVKQYPDAHLLTDYTDHHEWVFNNAGGAMGAMYIIHASITEYLIIFGSATGTEGHTGLHTADDYFHMLTGEEWAYEAGALTREIYKPGSVHHLVRGVKKQYVITPESWSLEYARGWIPPMLPFGFADMMFSTLDWGTMYHTTRITAREMISNLLRGKL
ncbi:C-8 sterol isomerase [Trichosporon asahii var. asahii CBS 8904]|uniref:C-8 sterol isomerase n=1 Tax=Trichosporon asahii var. asahii (strain CBS 8904) TaxID=1220162 RepID=K1VK73_TRIAC|nr:C-8 sterol isomerase [Trichosporon asahii var. asahii CBS 8904]